MATGLEVYDALKEATRGLPAGSEVALSWIDARDLGKLTADQLSRRGYEEALAERVSESLLPSQSLVLLGESMGLKLVVRPDVRTVIPLIRIRETAGALADEPETLEQTFEELDRIRHPERYAS